ncbi:GNAT family N-acetyltransferase [Marispirochaeta sp.]|jgi:ribosomal protein S18 acetylase RimI-like enzyme|uniref:GNAT family N-acetyltransferase n=1 Tax=Marispirochaeta sp. TaxID=2038653 RepID=UPI0029C8E79F|nr:GNAT family N-acetyltransferase [Marispirochaeta sp.]
MIRILTQIDIPQAHDLFRTATEDMISRGIDQWDEVYPALSDIREDLEQGWSFGSFDGPVLTGYVALNESCDPEYTTGNWQHNSGRPLYLHRLAVRPAYQGQGIAGRIISFALEHAAENGYTALRLDAFPPNKTAVAMYEKRGFTRAGYVQFRKGRFVLLEKVL